MKELRITLGTNREYGYKYEMPDQTWKRRVDYTGSRIHGIWAESLADEKQNSEKM